jgi:hypothetical protein
VTTSLLYIIKLSHARRRGILLADPVCGCCCSFSSFASKYFAFATLGAFGVRCNIQ